MASTYLSRTQGTGNRQIFTYSAWIKRSDLGEGFLFQGYTSTSSFVHIKFDGNNKLQVFGKTGGSDQMDLVTSRVFRDTGAFYHVIVAIDTTQSTDTNRVKVYINGVQETSFSTTSYPSVNANLEINVSGYTNYIGAQYGSQAYYGGLMSYVAFVDGTAELPIIFGETDATTGEWKIKTSITPTSGWGNNGFLILKDGNSVTDQSSNSNNFTLGGGTLTKTEDNPDNVFATFNPLRPNSISQTYSNGNNTFIRTGTGGQMNGTLGVQSGKWYYECLLDDYWQYLGWTALSLNTSQTAACSSSGSGFYGLYSNATDALTYANGTSTAQGSYTAMASGQTWGIAFDADNAKMYFSVNGVWENSSDPANQTNPAMSSIPVTDFLVPAIGQGTGSRSSTIKINFGNGYFGTTQISSEGTNASGIGKFEYDVPTGFTALSTKGLNE